QFGAAGAVCVIGKSRWLKLAPPFKVGLGVCVSEGGSVVVKVKSETFQGLVAKVDDRVASAREQLWSGLVLANPVAASQHLERKCRISERDDLPQHGCAGQSVETMSVSCADEARF